MISTTHDSTPAIPPDTQLEQAFAIYLDRRRLHLKARSIENYQFHFRSLVRFFGAAKPLSSFHEGDLRAYQKWRSAGGEGRRKAGASCINHEMSALGQVLELAALWAPISRYYERIREPDPSAPRVLSQEEEERFFRFASRKPQWRTVLNAIRLTVNTTLSGCELRGLRLGNLRLHHNPPTIRVPEGVKNKYRVRVVPLNSAALEASRSLMELARERGSCDPEHFLIAYRVKKGVYDPNRPASSTFIRGAFRAIARSCGLAWATPTSFRHQAITKLLENGAPDETVRAIAGHVSEKMMRHYSHIRIEAKKAAVDRLTNPPPKPKSLALGRTASHSVLAEIADVARQLNIPRDAALELVLQYERIKSARRA